MNADVSGFMILIGLAIWGTGAIRESIRDGGSTIGQLCLLIGPLIVGVGFIVTIYSLYEMGYFIQYIGYPLQYP